MPSPSDIYSFLLAGNPWARRPVVSRPRPEGRLSGWRALDANVLELTSILPALSGRRVVDAAQGDDWGRFFLLSDHWRCRFLAKPETTGLPHAEIARLLGRIAGAGFDFIKTENLCTFDGQKAYSSAE